MCPAESSSFCKNSAIPRSSAAATAAPSPQGALYTGPPSTLFLARLSRDAVFTLKAPSLLHDTGIGKTTPSYRSAEVQNIWESFTGYPITSLTSGCLFFFVFLAPLPCSSSCLFCKVCRQHHQLSLLHSLQIYNTKFVLFDLDFPVA